ncbi:MAG: hypothetical protein WCH99_10835, partial [Verrucomicrobiota bacterium]
PSNSESPPAEPEDFLWINRDEDLVWFTRKERPRRRPTNPAIGIAANKHKRHKNEPDGFGDLTLIHPAGKPLAQ